MVGVHRYSCAVATGRGQLSSRAETGGFRVRETASGVETPEEVESSAED
jgi:hypothetical protein